MTAENAAAADAVIRVDGLRKAYGETRAVDGVSFEVRPGTVSGLLGPNGAGKTTTVEVLEGLRTPDSGNVRILSIDAVAHQDELKPRIGVSLQTAALYPKLTVVEVLDLFRGFYRRGRPTNELVELMDLGEKRSTRTQDLSGGQRQRLSVALALVNDPELVFLDEPTTGMDPAARRALWDIVLGLKAEGRSSLFHVQIAGSWLLIGALILLGSLTFIALGYVIASFASTEDAANGMTGAVQFPLMFLSGTFFPIDAMPDALRTVARALPLTYLGDALRQVMVDGTPFSPLLVCFAVLIAWLVVCFGIAARFFRWQ